MMAKQAFENVSWIQPQHGVFFNQVTNASGHLVKYQVSPVFDNDFNPVPDSYRVSTVFVGSLITRWILPRAFSIVYF